MPPPPIDVPATIVKNKSELYLFNNTIIHYYDAFWYDISFLLLQILLINN